MDTLNEFFLILFSRGPHEPFNETPHPNYSNSTSVLNIPSGTRYAQQPMYGTAQHPRPMVNARQGNNSRNNSHNYYFSPQSHPQYSLEQQPEFDSRDDYRTSTTSKYDHHGNHMNYSTLETRSQGPPLPLYQGNPTSFQVSGAHGSRPYTHYRSDRQRIDSAKV